MLQVLERVVLSERVVGEFIYLMEQARDVQFEIGDRLIEQVLLHGKNKGEVINYLAGVLNVSASVLYDYYRVAEKWSVENREIYQSLDWTIYRNADPSGDVDLLNKAIDEGWNATKFKEEKFPAMKSPENVYSRVRAILVRHKKTLKPEAQLEVELILLRLENLLGEVADDYMD